MLTAGFLIEREKNDCVTKVKIQTVDSNSILGPSTNNNRHPKHHCFGEKINRSIHQKQTVILSFDSHLFHSILDNLNKHKYFTRSQILLDMGSNFFVCQPPSLPVHYGCTCVASKQRCLLS